jgi:hypothetical protein
VHEVTLVVLAPVWLGFVPAQITAAQQQHSSSTAAAQQGISKQVYCYGTAMWQRSFAGGLQARWRCHVHREQQVLKGSRCRGTCHDDNSKIA